ncbi:UPF0187-domain-containing protein [Roridomyces roridus]|uniref:UPF0187-domain-containing protein n=1 Tax=Roridomyces roridus TaxID=1738132 RepID=A0AAD7F5V8_9AGAR|nr:UPF0187-domain-containing protein [Roridomyces roridus]
MVASNPLFQGGLSMKKFSATVVNDIWPEVAFFTAVATMVATITEMKIHNLAINSALLTVLGTVLGLVISFRTSSAYERYQDGRKMWTNISIASRNIAQIIWIHVPFERTYKDKTKMTITQSVVEKKSMINLVQAFSVAVKHSLRGETGVYFQDLYSLICFLPRYANAAGTGADMLPLWAASEDDEYPLSGARPPPPSREATIAVPSSEDGKSSPNSWFRRKPSSRQNSMDPEKALADVQSHRPLGPARDPPPASIYDYFPFLRIFSIFVRPFRKSNKKYKRDAFGRKIKPSFSESNVPIEVAVYLNKLFEQWLAQPALATGLMNNIASLQDTMANLERIGNTPLPFAYQAHLRMSLWLYLLFLPFQVVSTMHYLIIPGTAFASFLLLGFLEIGIENPFGYDENDLDLDGFCLAIQRELHEITAHTTPEPSTFVFTSWNQPFAPADRRSAEELTRDAEQSYQHADHPDTEPGMATIRRTLLKNWRDVDIITRQ